MFADLVCVWEIREGKRFKRYVTLPRWLLMCDRHSFLALQMSKKSRLKEGRIFLKKNLFVTFGLEFPYM